MKFRNAIILLIFVVTIQAVSADVFNTTIQTTVVNTPYLDINIWILITLLGFGFMILSNITKPEQNAALWSIIAPFFIGASAYFSLQLQSMTITPYLDTDSMVHISIEQIVFHPEWLAIVMGIMFVFSVINVFYVFTKKPVERPGREEIYGGNKNF